MPAGVSGAVIEVKVVDDDAIHFDKLVEENQILSENIEPFVIDLLNTIGSESSNKMVKGAVEWLTHKGFDYFVENKGALAKLFGRAITGMGSIAYDLIAAEDNLGTAYIELDRSMSASGLFQTVSADGKVEVEYELQLAFVPTVEQPPVNRAIWFRNDCHRPLKVALHYLDPDNGWTTNGWWHFDGMTADYLEDGDGSNTWRIQSASDLFYFYAEATDESGDYWAGDLAIEFADTVLQMREITLTPDSDDDYVLSLTCDLPTPEPPVSVEPEAPHAINTDYPEELDRFVQSVDERLADFDIGQSGISAEMFQNDLAANTEERLSVLVQEVWSEWIEIASQAGVDAVTADPGSYGGLSSFRQLVIRLIQARQGTLNNSEQCALYSYFTRQEDPTVWYENVDGVISAVNNSCF